MNLNSSPSPSHVEQINDVDHDQYHQALNFGPNRQAVSLSSTSCHLLFNSTQDHTGFYHRQLYQPHLHEGDNYTCRGGSSYEIKNKVESGPRLSLWKKKDQGPVQNVLEKDNQVEWISSKMKMKNPDRIASSASIATTKIEVQKLQPSSSFETNRGSNSSLYNSNSSSYNGNTPIRVCSDCHTTKTPLWRSGPKGPKSLCNACGIRQRKARRAMVAAAASANGTGVNVSDEPWAVKIKVQCSKEKTAKNAHSSQFKKRFKMTAATAAVAGLSGSSGKKKVGFEDFLINLSNKLAFHQVFPQDEKDAAILLMALSAGLVHG